MERLTSNAQGLPTKTVENGREYLVTKISLIVPGVLAGSKGNLYYPLEEVKKNPGVWNNIPITLLHPTDPITGQQQSAKDKKVLDRVGVGFLRNDRWESGKRVADGYIDVERLKIVDRTVYNAIVSGQKLEVSTGLYTRNLPALHNSHYNGKQYHSIATNYAPDHLAILGPYQVGACSLKDGCGLNVNSRSIESIVDEILNANPEGCNQHTGSGCGTGSKSLSSLRQEAHGKSTTAASKTLDAVKKYPHEEAEKAASVARKASRLASTGGLGITGKTPEHHKKASKAHQKAAKAHHDATMSGSISDDGRKAHAEAAQTHRKAADLHFDASRITMNVLNEIDAIINQGRHLESGQFLNKTGSSIKQLMTAASKGFADLDGEQHTEEIESMNDENDIDTLLENVNPEGCNQHTGPGCGSGGGGKSKKGIGKSASDYDVGDTVYDQGISTPGKVVKKDERNVWVHFEGGDEDFPSRYSKADLQNETLGFEKDPTFNIGGKTMTLTEQQKETAVTYLTTNCECWKGKEKVLNEFDDDHLIEILKDVRNRENDTIIANSVRSGIKIGDETIKYDPDKKTLVKNMEGNGKKGSKMMSEEIAEEEDETPEELEPEKKKAKAPPMVKNEMTNEQFDQICVNHFGHPAATVKAGLGVAMEMEQAKRQNLVKRLVANVSDNDRKKELATNLLKKPISELETMVELLPPMPDHIRNRKEDTPNLNFLGIGGGPVSGGRTDNYSTDEVLELPTINWADQECVSPAFRKKN